MIVNVTFGSFKEHGEYKTVRIEPTANRLEAILRGEAQLDNSEDWFWAFSTTEQDLTIRPNWEINEFGEYLDDLTFQG
jgi:hypothetical protein